MTTQIEIMAPAPNKGWRHVRPVFVYSGKMVHNCIEYGQVKASAERFEIKPQEATSGLDLGQITENWYHSSVGRSWLPDLISNALQEKSIMERSAANFAYPGKGHWTAKDA